MAIVTSKKCREEFEKWCRTKTFLIPLRKNKKPSYRFAMTKYFWANWQASWKAALKSQKKGKKNADK